MNRQIILPTSCHTSGGLAQPRGYGEFMVTKSWGYLCFYKAYYFTSTPNLSTAAHDSWQASTISKLWPAAGILPL